MGTDFERIAERLEATLVGRRQLTGGVSARVDALELRDKSGTRRTVVVRRPAGDDAGATRREFALLAALESHLPVPRTLLIEDDGRYFVMEHVDGTTQVDPTSERLARMAELLARVHGLDFGRISGLPSLPNLEDPRAHLHLFLEDSKHAVVSRVKTHRFRDHVPCLLHGDFWPGNLLWRNDGLVAILDWEAASIGDPLSDLACARVELRCAYGVDASDEFTRRYTQRRPVDAADLAVWDIYVAATALHSMSDWNLDPSVEAYRRTRTDAFLKEAEVRLATMPAPR